METELKDIQKAELNILKEFIRVCNELNLTYYLAAGTLLGCIRHKGFIPWDDDIDVCMPRDDYEIFNEKGQAFLQERYFLQNYKTEPEYTMNFSKIRDSQTTFIEKTAKNLNINHGVYIDIFPLDGFKPEKKLHNLKNKFIFFIHKAHIAQVYYLSNSKSLKMKLLKIFNFFSSIYYRNKSITDILKEEDEIAKKYKYSESKYVSLYSLIYDNCVLKENYGKGKLMKFEDIEAIVPDNYDIVLKDIYGDYMKLPPPEQRIGHHYREGIDLNMPYKEYIQIHNTIKGDNYEHN